MSTADLFRHPIGDGTTSPTFMGLFDDGYYALRVFRQPDLDYDPSNPDDPQNAEFFTLGQRHLGFDWNATYDSDGNGDGDIGEPIYAIANGKIVYSNENHPGFGKVVVIEHTLPDDSVIYSLYAHLDSIAATSGDVSIGDKVGELGDSGLDPGEGAHLHLEVFSVDDGSSYLEYLNNGLPSRPGWFAYTNENEAGDAPYDPDTLLAHTYSDGAFTWYNPFTYVEARGVSETISFADAADEFGVLDGSVVAEVYLKSIFGSAISNVTYAGSESAAFLVSEFEIPGVDISLKGGILLSSGGLPGPSNTSGSFTVAHGTAGDADLDEIVSAALPTAGSTQDASVLVFDIFIDDPDVDGIRFDIVFGSDEYSEYSSSSFVDIAAVWVDDDRDGDFDVDENKALFNGDPTTPLSVIDKNLALNFVDNEGEAYATEWDGFGALAVRPELQQGWNSIKIAVADTGDQSLDSGIYVTNFALLRDGATGDDVFKVVNGAAGQNDLQASETKEEFNLAEGSGSVIGTLKELSGDVVTGFTEQIKLIIEQVNLLKEWVKVTLGSAILDIDENGDGTIDGTITLEGDFEGAEFNVNAVGENTEITVNLPSENSSPVAVDDTFTANEDQMLAGNVLDDNGDGADSDPDGDDLTVSLISGPAEGLLILNDDGSFSYEADADVFDLAAPGDVIEQSFTYKIDDGNGDVDEATATISVTILNDGETFAGGNGRQALTGTDGGEDVLLGENGRDELYGLDGSDTLDGGRGDDLLLGGEGPDFLFGQNGDDQLYGDSGNDELNGGRGNDLLRGGLGDDLLTGDKGNDTFVFALGEGTDTVFDYGVGGDLIGLDGLSFGDLTIGQAGNDATISSNGEVLAVLIGVDSSTLGESDFVFVA